VTLGYSYYCPPDMGECRKDKAMALHWFHRAAAVYRNEDGAYALTRVGTRFFDYMVRAAVAACDRAVWEIDWTVFESANELMQNPGYPMKCGKCSPVKCARVSMSSVGQYRLTDYGHET